MAQFIPKEGVLCCVCDNISCSPFAHLRLEILGVGRAKRECVIVCLLMNPIFCSVWCCLFCPTLSLSYSLFLCLSLLCPLKLSLIAPLFPQLEIHDDTFLLNVVACMKFLRENFSLRLLRPHPQDR